MTYKLSRHDQLQAAAIIELGPRPTLSNYLCFDCLALRRESTINCPLLTFFNFLVNNCVLFKHRLLIQKLYSQSMLLRSGHTACIFLGHRSSPSFPLSSPPFPYSLAQIPRLSPSAMRVSNMKSIPTPYPAHFTTLLPSLNHNLIGNESSQTVFLTACGATAGPRDPTHT